MRSSFNNKRVDAGRGLVQHQNLRVAQQRTRHAEQLPLANRDVVAVLHNLVVKAAWQRLYSGFEVHTLQRPPDGSIVVLLEWIEVVSHRAHKQNRILERERGGGVRKTEERVPMCVVSLVSFLCDFHFPSRSSPPLMRQPEG